MALGSPHPTTLLLGGGYTLERVAKLLPEGDFVITSRSSSALARFKGLGWETALVDTAAPESLERALDAHPSIELVIDSVPPFRETFEPALGIQNVLRVIRGRGISRFIYLSTTGVFGVRDGSWVDENTPPKPWNQAGEARWVSENTYRAADVPATILRLPAIVGPGRSTLESLRDRRYRLVGSGLNWTNRIHVDDLATVLVALITQKVEIPLLCVSDDMPVIAREMVAFYCEKYGVPWPESVSEESLLERGVYSMLSNQRVRNDLMKRTLNLSLRYPSYQFSEP